jgi:hypothetical protein
VTAIPFEARMELVGRIQRVLHKYNLNTGMKSGPRTVRCMPWETSWSSTPESGTKSVLLGRINRCLSCFPGSIVVGAPHNHGEATCDDRRLDLRAQV